ncbi:MAG: Gfo/Idh/MocA family oxidoreductase [Candidatus Microsaccharimonas sp.]
MQATTPHYKTKNVRVCVVGAGSIGSLHVELHANNISINDLAVIETDPSLQDTFRTQGYTVYDSLEASFVEQYDVYDICLPTFLHKHAIELILEKTDAKIMSEKPLVLNSDEFLNLIDSHKDMSERLVCAYVERFNDPFIQAEAWSRAHSGPYTMHFTRRTKKPIRQDWFSNPEKGGDVILDLAIHDIDASLWFCKSTFKKVISYTRIGDSEILKIEFNDGSVATYEMGWDISSDSEEGIINNFTVDTSNAAYHYDSKTESIAMGSKTQNVMPRFPMAYQKEMNAAEILPAHIDSSFASIQDIEQAYQIINALQHKRNNE